MNEALDNLLAEVRVQAELAVRTEYENTVAMLRAEVGDLKAEVSRTAKEREDWRRLALRHEDRLLITKAELEKLIGTLL